MNCSATVARRSLRARRIMLLLSTVIGTAGIQPAIAQLAPPAPVRPSVDANGVDLFSGTMTAKGAPMVLGRTDGAGLSYYQVNTGTGWTDNTIASLNQSGNVVTVALGGYSDSFNVSGSTFTPTEGNGATLTHSGNVFTYTRSDGTVIHFDFTRAASYPYYANNGRVTDITSPSGLKLTFSYYGINYCSSSKASRTGTVCTLHSNAFRVTTVASSAGYSLSFSYGELDPYDPNDANNGPNFTEFSTVLGVSSSNTVTGGSGPSESFAASTDGNGYNVLTITDPAGRATLYRSNFYGIAAIRLPTSGSDDVTVSYGSNGRVSGVTTSIGTTTYSSSDGGGNRTVTVTDPGSNVTTYVFSLALQRMTSITDALGHVTSSTYDASGRITQVTQPELNGISYTYDVNGNITAISANPKGGGASQPVRSALYPCSSSVTCNEPQWTRDALGNETDYAYDGTTGEVTSVTQPAAANGTRPQTRYTYTSVGGVSLPASISQCQTTASCTGTADEAKTTIAYNSNLLPTSVSTGTGDNSLTATSVYSYDAVGNMVSVDGPLPGTADTTTASYDADREIVQTTGPDPDGGGPLKQRSVTVAYLGTGQVSAKTIGTVDSSGTFTALQQISSSYDENHRKVQDIITAGGITYGLMQYGYDSLGRLQCTVQRMNPSSWTSQSNACQQAASGSFGADRISFTHYDTLSRPDYVTSAYTTADAATEHLSYTVNSKTASVTDANGNVTNYAYDSFDRLQTTTYPAGSYEQLTYDANGNVKNRRLRDGQVLNYSYDALNRRTYDDNPGTNVGEADVSYSYDNLGRILTAGDQNGWTVALSYDALGRVTRQSSNLSSNAFTYDLMGNRLSQTWGDGFYVTFDYDILGEMTDAHDNAGNQLFALGYDDLGRRTYISRPNGDSTGYQYDGASRLTTLVQTGGSPVTFGYSYNPAGQITGRTSSNDAYAFTQSYNVDRAYSVNALNQYTQTGSIAPSYDGRGNLTQAGGQTYVYNTRNQLFQTGDTSQLFYRGPTGTLGQIQSGGGGENLDYVGSMLATELNASNGTVLRRYVYGPGSDEPLVWYEGTGTSDRRFLHADERGSVIAVTNDAGNALAINTYDEYGIPGSNNLGRFQYTGQKWIPELGMYDYKARMYSPTLGRFMQTDPIGYGDGLNWYGYTHADPINGMDTAGTDDEFPLCHAGDHCLIGGVDNDDHNAAADMLAAAGLTSGNNSASSPQANDPQASSFAASASVNSISPTIASNNADAAASTQDIVITARTTIQFSIGMPRYDAEGYSKIMDFYISGELGEEDQVGRISPRMKSIKITTQSSSVVQEKEDEVGFLSPLGSILVNNIPVSVLFGPAHSYYYPVAFSPFPYRIVVKATQLTPPDTHVTISEK